jgi:acetyltransferase-like isoleucine patch superfamily enzyme
MRIKSGDNLIIGRSVLLIEPQNISMGANIKISDFSRIAAYEQVIIGNNFLGASFLSIDAGSHELNGRKNNHKRISIGDNVWCASRVTICAGAIIGNNCVIGAGSVVLEKYPIPDNFLACGIPAKPVKPLPHQPPIPPKPHQRHLTTYES